MTDNGAGYVSRLFKKGLPDFAAAPHPHPSLHAQDHRCDRQAFSWSVGGMVERRMGDCVAKSRVRGESPAVQRQRRSSFTAPVRALGPRGFQPRTRRSYAFSACSLRRCSLWRTVVRLYA